MSNISQQQIDSNQHFYYNQHIYSTMKNDKGREGGPKIGKMSRRRLWMAPKKEYEFLV